MGAGKSTLAQAFVAHDPRFCRAAFADQVKHIATTLFGMDPAQKDRPLLQAVGTKMREVDKDVWIDYVLKRGEAAGRSHVVVDDVRYANEAYALKRAGFVLIAIEIDAAQQLERLKACYPSTWEQHYQCREHSSEQGGGGTVAAMADVAVQADSISTPSKLAAFVQSVVDETADRGALCPSPGPITPACAIHYDDGKHSTSKKALSSASSAL